MKTIIAVLLTLSLNTLAQTSVTQTPAPTPTEVANVYLSEMISGNVYELGKHYHPEAQKDFRQIMQFIFGLEDDIKNSLVKEIFGIGVKPYQLKLMSNEEFLSGFIENVIVAVFNEFPDISLKDMHAIGEVYEGENQAYVITKILGSVAGVDMESYDVLPFKKDKGIWKAMLTSKIKVAALSLQNLSH